ncbi:hypothetical protein [Vallitalea sp.]|jgi:hypothetical protein|uniref:hypothetical protein n=1 Tax=Vallitalea sp. TaxID=1882829 RepID=UPI0025CBDB38|nr:hypothetical protein [Vallitalea sp.]MCT4688156.1 hypothetical protein [Vallitalea sp.]
MEPMNFSTIKNNIRTNKNLESTLEQLAENYQFSQYKVAVYDLLFNCITFLEMLDDTKNNNYLLKDSQSKEITKWVIAIFDNYANLESLVYERQDLMKIRDKIESNIEMLSYYTDEVETYEYILNRIEGRFIHNYYDLEDDSSFAGNLLQFIFETDENIVINEKIKLTLSQLPIRITKNKFHEYIENSLELYKGAYISDLNNFIDMLKGTAILGQDYKGYHRDIWENIEILRNTDYKNIEKPQYDNIVDIKIDIANKIEKIYSVYTLGASIINNLIEISYCDRFSSFADNDTLHIVDELFHIIKIKGEKIGADDELFNSLERIEGVIETNLGDIEKYAPVIETANTKYNKFIKEYGFSVTYKNIQKLDYMSATSSYFMNPEKMDMTEDDDRIDEFTLAKIKKELIFCIDEYLKDKSQIYRRAIMSRLLYYLPVTFKKPQEIHSYIINSLEQCSDLNEKNASKELLRQVIDDLSPLS